MWTSIDIGGIVVFAALCAGFIIVLVCSHKALRKTLLFGNAGGGVIAVSVALLSVVGLVRFFGLSGSRDPPSGQPGSSGGLDFILLPYVALAFLLVPLSLLVVFKRKKKP
jgi:hypothetical protein